MILSSVVRTLHKNQERDNRGLSSCVVSINDQMYVYIDSLTNVFSKQTEQMFPFHCTTIFGESRDVACEIDRSDM